MSSYVFWQFYSSFLPGFLSYWFHLLLLLLSCVQLFVTPWTAACQASLSFTISQSVLKLMSIESVMPSSHLTLCHPLLLPSIFPSIRVFSNESVLCIRWPKYGASASASVLAMNIQGWFPLELTGLISLLSKGLPRVVSRTTVQNHQFFGTQWIDDFSIVVLWFPSLSLLCISWRFLLCDFHKACIKYHITIYFMLMTATYSLGLLFNCFNYFLFSYFRSTSDKVMFS